MHFEITASQQAIRKPLTPAQRRSSLFSEAPRIGATTLRRGQSMKLDSAQFKAQESAIKRLFDAGAIEIVEVDGEHRHDLRSKMDTLSGAVKKVAEEFNKHSHTTTPPPAPQPPPSAPKAASVIELPATPPPEPVKAEEPAPVEPAASEVVAETPAPEAAPAESSSKGKKGRR